MLERAKWIDGGIVVSQRFPRIPPLQNRLFTPESQWQSRGQAANLTGVGGNWERPGQFPCGFEFAFSDELYSSEEGKEAVMQVFARFVPVRPAPPVSATIDYHPSARCTAAGVRLQNQGLPELCRASGDRGRASLVRQRARSRRASRGGNPPTEPASSPFCGTHPRHPSDGCMTGDAQVPAAGRGVLD